MTKEGRLKNAAAQLTQILNRVQSDRELEQLTSAKDIVESRFHTIFQPENIPTLSAEDFRDFLLFKHNRHWIGLHRLSGYVCADMEKLRQALAILVNEEQSIEKRLDKLVPTGKPNFIKGLGKAILTPVLMLAYPDRYSVWNSISEAAMIELEIWPKFPRGESFGKRYKVINEIQLQLVSALNTDPWTLDALWWRVTKPQIPKIEDTEATGDEETQQLFALERHLHEFLVDNWSSTELGKEWSIFEEDGDPLAGYEYVCDVGRIDILARHKKKSAWLIVELKRNQGSDQTIGQVLRYAGWVKKRLAEPGDEVTGLIIAHQVDDALKYALTQVKQIDLRLYEVEFHLRKSEDVSEFGTQSSRNPLAGDNG